MTQWIFLLAGALSAAANNWSFLETKSSDPNVRMEQLLNVSEGPGQIPADAGWSRFWMNDQPSHLTPIRVHGGIGP
jgi:hypothetical protein